MHGGVLYALRDAVCCVALLPRSGMLRAPMRRPLLLLISAAGLALLVLLVRVAREKGFSIDEFQYAHASWLVANGQLPYRDFFEVHFPLVYLLGAALFRMAGDDPTGIVLLRWMMLGFALMACAAVALVNRGRSPAIAALGPLLLVATSDWTALATEIRPDAVGAACFVASLAALVQPWSPRARCLTAGVFAGLGAVSAQKAAFYVALTFAAVLVVDLLGARRGRRRTLERPWSFLAGGLAGAAPVLALLLGPGMAEAAWKWAVVWGAEHQRGYPGFSWTREGLPLARRAALLLPLAAVGLFQALRRREDFALVAALAATFLSAAGQTAPFRYSFIPVLALLAIFAARGVDELVRARSHPALRWGLRGCAVALAGLSITQGAIALTRRLDHHNAQQLQTLQDVARLTRAEHVAYDNSGSFVARPHVDFYFYTDKYLRLSRAAELERALPGRIVERGCVLKLTDLREEELPPGVRAFLRRHFQPWSGDLSLWGQRYEAAAGAALETTFLASRAGRYFVQPASVISEGRLELGGVRVTAPEVELEEGTHALRYAGPAATFHLLWLPADGQRWTPVSAPSPRFSRVFY